MTHEPLKPHEQEAVVRALIKALRTDGTIDGPNRECLHAALVKLDDGLPWDDRGHLSDEL